jgi:type II secretory pathway component PulF
VIPNFKFAVIYNTFAKELPAEEASVSGCIDIIYVITMLVIIYATNT